MPQVQRQGVSVAWSETSKNDRRRLGFALAAEGPLETHGVTWQRKGL